MSHLKKLRENNTTAHKPTERKQILRRVEISKTENKGKIVKLDKGKIWSFKKVNKIEKKLWEDWVAKKKQDKINIIKEKLDLK